MYLKSISLATAAVLITLTTPAHAGLFDRINETMDKIDNAITETEDTIDRASGTAERLNTEEPAAGDEQSRRQQRINERLDAQQQAPAVKTRETQPAASSSSNSGEGTGLRMRNRR